MQSVSWSFDWGACVGLLGNTCVMFARWPSMTVAMKCLSCRVPSGYAVISLLEPKCWLVMLFVLLLAFSAFCTGRVQTPQKCSLYSLLVG